MSEEEKPIPQIVVRNDGENVSIEILAPVIEEQIDSWSIQALKSIQSLLDISNIKKVVYVDDVYEIADNYSAFVGKIEVLLEDGKKEDLKKAIKEVEFELPEEALKQAIKKAWDENPDKRNTYLKKVVKITGEDADFDKDLQSKRKIEEYFAEGVLRTLSPSEWQKKSKEILEGIAQNDKGLFLFDNILTHSPPPLNTKEGLEFVTELLASPHQPKVICGLLTHTVPKDKEFSIRRKFCDEKNIPFEQFFLLSKERAIRALQFADGIKKALLTSSCELIKRKTIDIISKAHTATLERLNELDAYAFDHIVINSSFREGIWEPETFFRINNFLSRDNAKREILRSQDFRDVINKELETARAIGRINIGEVTYDDHLLLRHQEIYESGELLNQLNSPIENGDIFEIMSGDYSGKYILVTQQCDLMIRNIEASRKSHYATLLKIKEVTEKSLTSEINRYNKQDAFRPHYFSSKFKLDYLNFVDGEKRIGIVDFEASVLVDMVVFDLAVFNSEGTCKIDCSNFPDLGTQLQSSWRKRLEHTRNEFTTLADQLDAHDGALTALEVAQLKKTILSALMPNRSFINGGFLNSSYEKRVFDFGISRIGRFREPGSTLLLNRYTKHLAREAEDHDFAG